MREWIKALNRWVIREEDLKKYTVIRELGSGGQAKVFMVTLPGQNGVTKTYAIKVISKVALLKQPVQIQD